VDVKAKGKKLKGDPTITTDQDKGTSTIGINKGRDGKDVEVGDNDTFKIEFPGNKNELKVLKAF
jgi:hypothetical protein